MAGHRSAPRSGGLPEAQISPARATTVHQPRCSARNRNVAFGSRAHPACPPRRVAPSECEDRAKCSVALWRRKAIDDAPIVAVARRVIEHLAVLRLKKALAVWRSAKRQQKRRPAVEKRAGRDSQATTPGSTGYSSELVAHYAALSTTAQRTLGVHRFVSHARQDKRRALIPSD